MLVAVHEAKLPPVNVLLASNGECVTVTMACAVAYEYNTVNAAGEHAVPSLRMYVVQSPQVSTTGDPDQPCAEPLHAKVEPMPE